MLHDCSSWRQQNRTLWNARFIICCLVTLFSAFGLQLINATQSIYILSIGGTTATAGLVVTLYTVAATVARLLIGKLSDQYGRKGFILAGGLLFAAAAFASTRFPNLCAILCLACLRGFGGGMQNTSNSAAAIDAIPPEMTETGISYFGLGTVLATALAPSISIALCDRQADWPVLAGAALYAVSVLLAAFLPTARGVEAKEADADKQVREPLLWQYIERGSIYPAMLQAGIMTALAAIIYYLAQFGAEKGYIHIGGFFTIAAAVTFLIRLFGGRLLHMLGQRTALIIACGAGVVLFVTLVLARSESLVVLSGALYGLANGVSTLVLNANAVQNARPGCMGAASSTYLLSIDLGLCIGSLLWGVSIAHLGFSGTFLLGALLLLLLIIPAAHIHTANSK